MILSRVGGLLLGPWVGVIKMPLETMTKATCHLCISSECVAQECQGRMEHS